MEAVKTQDVGVNDLPWIIEYHADRCTMCGSCVASCSFNAIKVVMQKQSLTVSEASVPTPKHTHIARPIIKQVASLTDFCRGCGMCEKICPNNAIHPVRNPDQRRHLLAKDNGPLKRGGRTNLNAQRALDSIVVGRISQMTDPSLDAARHTFDIRAPFGRVLDSHELPFEIVDGKLVKKHRTPPVQWIYPLIFSDMSIGALSTRAWEAVALAVGYLNEKCGLPVRMSSGEGGMPVKLLESEYLKYFIIQIASGHFGWNRIIKAMPHMVTDPGGVLIKIGQGAKPGIGGHLPGAKITEDVSMTRMIPVGTDAISPAPHHDIYSIEDLKQLVYALKEATEYKKPIIVKVAAVHNIAAIASGIARSGADIIAIDGFRGGTGAAPTRIRDNVGIPVELALAAVDSRLREEGIRENVSLVAGGSIRSSADVVKAIALGADAVYIATSALIALGCHLCRNCQSGKCNWGIATQIPELVERLDPEKGSERLVNLLTAWDHEIKEFMGGMGINSIEALKGNRLMLRGVGLNERELAILGIKHAGE